MHLQVTEMDEDGVPRQLSQWLAPLADRNVFNPSVVSLDGVLHVAYRAFGPGPREKPFRAYHAVFDPRRGPDQPTELVDLSAVAARHGVPKAADPKLFEADGRVFATFNTGHLLRPPTANDIYVVQVWPEVGPLQRCVLEPRRLTEKNWAFHVRDGVLRVLYSLDPLTELTLVSGTLGADEDLVFSHPQATPSSGSPELGERPWLVLGKRVLTLGTQPVLFDGDLYLVAHEKLHASKWRIYVGKLVRLRPRPDGALDVEVSRHRLIHSRRAARPRLGGVHNPNVLTVTYFSGLTVHDGRLLVSYGVNDVASGFGHLDPRRLLD